ncbi:MAG: hypothetical protein HUJ89_01910, partial [Bacteroidales bacterium]|nr:hypothetical protein [Bacteroidales bacterium]
MKTNPFKVPEGYAERLQCVLSEKLESEKPERVPMWWRVAKPALLMACMFGIIFGMAAGIRSL